MSLAKEGDCAAAQGSQYSDSYEERVGFVNITGIIGSGPEASQSGPVKVFRIFLAGWLTGWRSIAWRHPVSREESRIQLF